MKLQVRNYKRDSSIVTLREKGGMTFMQIGTKLGISKVRVRQLYMRIVSERQNRQMGVGA